VQREAVDLKQYEKRTCLAIYPIEVNERSVYVLFANVEKAGLLSKEKSLHSSSGIANETLIEAKAKAK
jgi:hypothetical protein